MQVTLIMMILWKAYALPAANHSATNEAGFKSRSLKQIDSEFIWHFELKSVCLDMYKTDGKDRESIAEADDDECTEEDADAEDTGIYDNRECYRGTCEEGLCICCHPLTESLAKAKDLKKPYGVWHGANCGQFMEIKKLKGELEDDYERWQEQKRLQRLEKQDQRKEELMAEDRELGSDYRPESPRKPKSRDPCVMGDTCFRGFCREDGKDLVCKDCFIYDEPLPGKYHGKFCTVFVPDYSFGERAKTPACVTDTDCTYHGFCNTAVQPSLCICDPGWSGHHCGKKPPTKCYSTDKGTCNKKGKCKKKTDVVFGKYRYCQCKKGYGGLACEKPFQCLKDGLDMCYPNHGKCKGSSKKECECTLDSSKYIGKYCRPKELQSGGADAVQTGDESGQEGDEGAERPQTTIAIIPAEFRHRGNGAAFSKELGDQLESGRLSPLEGHLQEIVPKAVIRNVRFNLEPTIIPIEQRPTLRLRQEEKENDVGSPNHDEKLVNGKSKSLKRSKSKSLKRSKSKSLKRSKSLVKRQDDAQQDIVTLFDVTFDVDEVEDVENIQELVTENLSEQTEVLNELYGSEFSYVEGSVKTGKVKLLSAGDDGNSNKKAFFAVIGAGGLFVIGGVCAVIKIRQSQASVGIKDKNKKKQPSKKSGKNKSALDVGSYTDGTEDRRKKSKSLASGKKSKSRTTSKAAVSAKSSNRSTAA